MSKFFNYTDFIDQCNSADQADHIANLANAKLEREAKIVYSYRPDLTWFTNQTIPNKECMYCGRTETECCRFYKIDPVDTHKALLINIEVIKKCKHENVRGTRLGDFEKIAKLSKVMDFYECVDCGKEVKPKTFEEV